MKELSTTELSKLSDKELLELSRSAHDNAERINRDANPFFWVSMAFLFLVIIPDNKVVVFIAFLCQITCLVIYTVLSFRSMSWRRYSIRILEASIEKSHAGIMQMIEDANADLKKQEADAKLSTPKAKKAKK